MIVADTINAAMMTAFGVSRFLIAPCLMARRIVELFMPKAVAASASLRGCLAGRTDGDFCGSAALKIAVAASASEEGMGVLRVGAGDASATVPLMWLTFRYH